MLKNTTCLTILIFKIIKQQNANNYYLEPGILFRQYINIKRKNF